MGTVMDNFGDQLRQERVRRNVALDEIARSTKIRIRYLQALEDGQHERLPGIVFAKGYVRAYAETIGADAERLVGAYVAEQRSLGRLETQASQENVLEALAAAVENDKDIASKRSRAALIASVIAIVAFAAFWFGVRPMIGREAPVASTTPPEAVVAAQQPAPGDEAVVTHQSSAPANESEPAREPPATEAAQTVIDTEVVDNETIEDVVTRASATPEPVDTAAVEPVETVQPEPEPAPAPAAAIAPTDVANDALATLSVAEYGVGTDVQRRVLVGEASEFETGTMVVFWNRVLGGEPGRRIRHVWFHEGNVNGARDLTIGAAHWRTYSKQTLRRDGNWTVEAQDEDGRVLARESFVATSRKL